MEERKQRSRLLMARDQYVQKLAAEAKQRLASAASSNATAYGNLLKGLIKQGLLRLEGETKVEVRCRPQDADKVRTIAPQAAEEITAELKAAGEIRAISISVKPDNALGASAGGVVLAAMDGRIRCDNTLEERLKLAMAGLTPVVRDLLFPSSRAEVRVKPAVHIHGKEGH
jgi:V-type H+-transporting ATPase subunit E